jgi:7-cyano-7-deazaguanine synthase
MKRVNILWTGGWDSTYRILRLMDKQVTIQPYYLKDKNRKSQQYELKAIKTITEDVRNHQNTKCELLDLIAINVSDIPLDDEVTNAYQNILKNNFYGSQYEWLARFAKNIENLEINMHKDDTANFFKKYGSLIKINDDLIGDYNVLDQENSSDDLLKVFGNFHYPILNISKLEMREWAINNGLIDIMNKTWFCYSPKNNQPCGRCNPCKYTINEGMVYRFSKSALRRYRIKKFFQPIKQAPIIKGLRKLYKRNWIK